MRFLYWGRKPFQGRPWRCMRSLYRWKIERKTLLPGRSSTPPQCKDGGRGVLPASSSKLPSSTTARQADVGLCSIVLPRRTGHAQCPALRSCASAPITEPGCPGSSAWKGRARGQLHTPGRARPLLPQRLDSPASGGLFFFLLLLVLLFLLFLLFSFG